MLYVLFDFSKTLAIGFLLNDYFKRHYPSEYRNFGIEILFNTIYLYSYCEMKLKKGLQYIENINPQFSEYIKEIFKNKIKILDIEFIKDNKIVTKHSKRQYLNSEEVVPIPEYDFILYSDTYKMPYNIKILQSNCKLCLSNAETYDYELSTLKFMLLEFIVGEKCYKIDLATSNYNFYIKDNILDKNFFLCYLRYIHKDKVIFEDDIEENEITIKIIDNNVNIHKISLTEDANKCIKLDTHGYEIIKKPL